MKHKTVYSCQSCGTLHHKWAGQCPDCGSWNTFTEDTVNTNVPKALTRSRGSAIEFTSLQGSSTVYPRLKTSSEEFNRVCGGGFVPGSVTLVGGDPGIGKSTLLLQLAAALAVQNYTTVYISGEEAIDQIRMRAQRLGVADAPIEIAVHTHMTDIISSLKRIDNLKLVIIDSIQTMYVDTVDSIPGTVSQVRATSHDLINYAKKSDVAVILIGHVTKEGTIAGPRVLEHMVDTVLYFEGERGHSYRILRGVKNRFGATDEIGVFSMTAQGLQDVANPSALFLGERLTNTSGTAVFAGMEGTRPILAEIQALISPSNFGSPRRNVIGWDSNRLSMVLAVLETRCGIPFGNKDVYLSITGGLKINEPAVDLAVAAALLSSLNNKALNPLSVYCGEIGLSSELRSISHNEIRLKEAAKLGFNEFYLPKTKLSYENNDKMHITQLSTIQEFAKLIFN